MGEQGYAKMKLHRLTARVRMYSAYIGCGCYGKHSRTTPHCARADFQRMARELCLRASPSTGKAPGTTPKEG